MLHLPLGLDIFICLSGFICAIIVLLVAVVKMVTNKSSICLFIEYEELFE